MKKFLLYLFTLLLTLSVSAKFTLVFVIVASLFVPFLALFTGIVMDALYAPTGGLPFSILVGLCISICAYVVHEFHKTRIMR